MKISAPALVAIVGPTAVGKTEVSIFVARALGAEIVSADSRLLYRGMDIGTAKPTADQMAGVPHHMIDVAGPEESWSLLQFKQQAESAIEAIQSRGKLALLVGGTGLYVTAILEGWSPHIGPPDDALRMEHLRYAEKHGPLALHELLRAADPVAAMRIEPNNVRRVSRALEIYQRTGAHFSEHRPKRPPQYSILRLGLGLPRHELYARIDRRIDSMIEAGLVDEVRSLLQRGISADHPPMSAIGYKQIAAHLSGHATLQEAVAETRRKSRQFVRRQANWFKEGDSRIEWYQARAGVEREVLARITQWLDQEA